MENFSWVFQKQRKKHMKRLSFITQFKIEFLLPFTGCRKVLGKMPLRSSWDGDWKEIPCSSIAFTLLQELRWLETFCQNIFIVFKSSAKKNAEVCSSIFGESISIAYLSHVCLLADCLLACYSFVIIIIIVWLCRKFFE